MNKYTTPKSKEELRLIYDQKDFDPKFLQFFQDKYYLCFNELLNDTNDYTDEDWEEEGYFIHENSLKIALNYLDIFLKQIIQGHGSEWSHLYANYLDETEIIFYHTYHDLKEINPDLARQEIITVAKSISDDEIFQTYYVNLFENLANPNNRIETAKKYSELYKKALLNRKTEIYAHQYADLMVDIDEDYNEIYCEEYAFAYDSAITQNKDEKYARYYAELYASALTDIKRRAGVSENIDMQEFAILKIQAHMIAWEYAKDNKIKDSDRFIEIFVNVFLNYEFADLKFSDETEKIILEKALERFIGK
jgi:hypothetical protein